MGMSDFVMGRATTSKLSKGYYKKCLEIGFKYINKILKIEQKNHGVLSKYILKLINCLKFENPVAIKK